MVHDHPLSFLGMVVMINMLEGLSIMKELAIKDLFKTHY